MPRSTLQKFTELAQFKLDPESIRMLPLPFCSRNQVVILGRFDLASQDPVHLGMLEHDEEMVHALAVRWARPVIPVALNQYEVNKALDAGFGTGMVGDTGEGYALDLKAPPATSESTATELVDDMLLHAVSQRASDVHLECYAGDVDVRLRIDGVLHQVLTQVSPENVSRVTNRIKILSGLDILEHRHPQDGRFRALVREDRRSGPVDFRVNVLPGPYGEDVVLRVLDTRVGLLPTDALGMSDEQRRTYEGLLANPEGAILITGPTGSGKTTTLYSALATLNDGSRKILTAEDPIEYYLPKVNQKQVTAQLTLSALSRAFLRQDPDVLLVGELRDPETAETAAKAAATGHLVLTTLHTSDSIGAVPRLRTLGLTDDEIADSLLLVVAQRLARRICPDCAEPAELRDEERRLLGPLAEGLTTLEGRGCESCRDTGCRGRTGIFELLAVDQELQRHISDAVPTHELRQELHRGGFVSLVAHGLEKVRRGVVSARELLRVVPYRQLVAEVKAAA